MVTIPSSIAVAAELSGLLAALSSAPSLVVRDAGGSILASQVLPTPVIFNQQIVLLNVAGQPIVTGLAVTLQPNSISIASSAVNPGGQLGILGGAIVLT
jgi:hypothetical protein